MKRILKTGLLLAFLLLCGVGAAQPPVLIHSHNDYTRTVPFYQAYAQRVSSIEADVFLRDGVLVVGHDVEDLVPEMTFEKLYVEPLVTLFARNGGRAWKDSDQRLQLMVELPGGVLSRTCRCRFHGGLFSRQGRRNRFGRYDLDPARRRHVTLHDRRLLPGRGG